jgi:hypothetical protein
MILSLGQGRAWPFEGGCSIKSLLVIDMIQNKLLQFVRGGGEYH